MPECDNIAMRDRLPDLLGPDDSGALAIVRAHVATCPACRRELALLEAVRMAVPSPHIDARRIADAIPPYRRQPAWSRVAHAPAFRLAAAILLVVGFGSLIADDPRRSAPDTVDVRPAIVNGAPAGEIAVGTPLADLSEADLQDLLDELGELEAVTPTEGDVVVIPAVGSGA